MNGQTRLRPTYATPRRLAAIAAALLTLPLVQAAPADASVSAGVTFPVLKITGDGFSDKVALRLRPGDATTVDVDFGDDGSFEGGFPRSTFNQVLIDMGAGADSVRIDDSQGVFTDTESTRIIGGDGNDTLSGGGGIETLTGGGGDDSIAGGEATDFSQGGPGNDTFGWASQDGDDVVAGDDGTDRLIMVGSGADEQVVIDRFSAPDDGQVRISRTASGRSSVTNVLRLGSVEALDLDSLGGNDNILASPDVGGLISLDIDAGSAGGIAESSDDDVVAGSDADDAIAGGPGRDRLDGRGGNDALHGDDESDTLIGGAGVDALTGGAGADDFQCEGPGEVLDAQPEDLVPAFCIQAPVVPGPAVEPTPASSTASPALDGAGLPSGFLGLGKPVVRATRDGLRVKVTNVGSAAIDMKVAASERFKAASGARTARYRVVKKTIAAGAQLMVRLRAPRALRTRIAAELNRVGRVARRPVVTVTNIATAAKRTVRPRLTLTASRR